MLSYSSTRLVVVGGGNSSGQAVRHLADCVDCHVTLVVRGDSFADSMSDYLIQPITTHPNINVLFNAVVTNARGTTQLEEIELTHTDTSTTEWIKTDELFFLIGVKPALGWLRGILELNDRGLILTGGDIAHEVRDGFENRCGRPPFAFETSLRGVFALGDCRAMSFPRVSGAVGAAAGTIVDVHRHLAELHSRQETLV